MKNKCVERLKGCVHGLYWLSKKSIDEFVVYEGVINQRKCNVPRFVLKIVSWDYDQIKSLVLQCVKRRLCKIVILQIQSSAVLNALNCVRDTELYNIKSHKAVAFRVLKNEWCKGVQNIEHLKAVLLTLNEGDLDEFVYNVLAPSSESSSSYSSDNNTDTTQFFKHQLVLTTPKLFTDLQCKPLDCLKASWYDILEAVGKYCIHTTYRTLQSLFILLVYRLNHVENYTRLEFYRDLKNGLERGDSNVGSYLNKPAFRIDTCSRFIKEFDTVVNGRNGAIFP